MQRSQINYINNALSLNRIRDVPYSYIKLNSSEVLVDTIFGNFKLKELFNRICQHINKRVVYGIKMMKGKEVIELYLYHSDYAIYQDYINDVILLFTLLNDNTNIDTHSRIIKTMSDNITCVVSYEIDDIGRLNTDYLDIYVLPLSTEKYVLPLPTEKYVLPLSKKKSKTLRYNLNDNTLTCVSTFIDFPSSELRSELTNRINSQYISNIMHDILHIVPTVDDKNIIEENKIIIHDKICKNSIGIYTSVGFAVLNTFLIERFGKSLPNNNGIFTDLEFGIHLDYNLDDGKICGFGFCDYF